MQQASSPAVFIRGAYLSHLHLRLSFKATSSSTAVLLLRELVLIFSNQERDACVCSSLEALFDSLLLLDGFYHNYF
jgi:hypothetical protein